MRVLLRADERPLSPRGRALRGYGPLVVVALVFALMATLAPTVDIPDASRTTAQGTGGPGGSAGSSGSGSTSAGGTTGGTSGTDGTSGTTGTSGTDPSQRRIVEEGQVVEGCGEQEKQVPGDPYSPPCVAFEGDNGGATHRGVTEDKITVSYRVLDEKGFSQTLAALAGAQIADDPEDVQRTVSAYADYFNERFQFYGRELDIAYFPGRGSSTDELLGGGQAEAQADALHVAQTEQAFIHMNGASAPFTDALARQEVIAFGTPYLSREWHMERAPYNWSLATDCSIVTETATQFYLRQLADKPAEHAGPQFQDQQRKVAALSPENPWYQECVDAGDRVAREAGHPTDLRITYRLDINSMSNQAANVIAKLKSEGVTSVLCGCDPIFPVFLSVKASEQDYYPEWIVVGSALTDHDLVGQLMDQEQWQHAFGVSFLGSVAPQRAGLGYAAYKAVRDDEPAFAAETIYATMYLIALGIQGAGPNLTPQTFEQGMFSYPGGTGPFGTWGFSPTGYTPTLDGRIIWWDPDRTSIYNNEQGAYVEAFGGQRFGLGEIPTDEADLFEE